MQLFLYTTEFPNELPPAQFLLLLAKLPAAIRTKILRYRKWQDAYGCLFGNHLLRMALRKTGSSHDLDQLQYSPEQKPFLPGGPHFNISHSAHRVVCLMGGHQRVGIDIEYISDISPEEFSAVFTDAEWMAICNSNAPKDEFYRCWTAKESLIKADGRGIGIPLKDVVPSYTESIWLNGIAWKLSRLTHFRGYACHISVEAGPDPDPCIEVSELTPMQIAADVAHYPEDNQLIRH